MKLICIKLLDKWEYSQKIILQNGNTVARAVAVLIQFDLIELNL